MEINKIKKYMKEKKITQVELSEKSGIPLGTLRNIFSGRVPAPRIDTINAITKALNLEFDIPLNNIDLSGMQIINYRTAYKNTIVLYDNSGDKFEFEFNKEDFNHVYNICEAITKPYKKIKY